MLESFINVLIINIRKEFENIFNFLILIYKLPHYIMFFTIPIAKILENFMKFVFFKCVQTFLINTVLY